MDRKLSGLLRESRRLAGERKQLMAEFRAELSLTQRIRGDLEALARDSRARLDRVAQRAGRASPPLRTAEIGAAALEAALAAYDYAFRAPSVEGLPSHAAVAAYMEILPEPEEVIRIKLAAALALRRPSPAGVLH
jgi:hypothetical protein